MNTIWKYPLNLTDTQEVDMPKGAHILTVQRQGLGAEDIVMWAIVNTEAPRELVMIEAFGTGHPIENGERSYIGTLQFGLGTLVFHFFKKENYGL